MFVSRHSGSPSSIHFKFNYSCRGEQRAKDTLWTLMKVRIESERQQEAEEEEKRLIRMDFITSCREGKEEERGDFRMRCY